MPLPVGTRSLAHHTQPIACRSAMRGARLSAKAFYLAAEWKSLVQKACSEAAEIRFEFGHAAQPAVKPLFRSDITNVALH